MTKYLFIGGLIAVVAWGAIGYQKRVNTNERYLLAPAVNDKYITDLSSFVKVAPGTWGVMKVVAVRGDQVDFVVSKRAYNKGDGPERDHDRGATGAADYYHDSVLAIPHSALQAAVKDNSIRYIRR
jgi:hypothetical protein